MSKPDQPRTQSNSAQPATIRVMVVDDHPVVRDGLKTMLTAFDDLELVAEAGSGQDALRHCQTTHVDVILMDMVMPDMDGAATTRAVLERHPGVRVVILTSFPKEDLVAEALDAGAIGYLLKNAPIDDLAGAVRSAHAGQSVLSPEATQVLMRAKTAHNTPGQDLSKREREVLALIVQGLSNEQIAQRLVISPATARHHVSACISKLGAANRAQAAALAVQHKLIEGAE